MKLMLLGQNFVPLRMRGFMHRQTKRIWDWKLELFKRHFAKKSWNISLNWHLFIN